MPSPAPSEPRDIDDLYFKLFDANNLPSIVHLRGGSLYEPEWSDEELADLAVVVGHGLLVLEDTWGE